MNTVRIDRAALKQDARAAMRAHKPSVYAVTFVFLLITIVLEALSAKLQYPGLTLGEIMRYAYDELQISRLISASANQSGLAKLLDAAVGIMNVMLSGGFMLFCLYVCRREDAGCGTLFDLFGYFFRFLWLNIVVGFFISLWTLLLVIPGIVAAYRYSMAVYIFFDDPNKGAMQCIRESRTMTMGNKGQLFLMDLSFIGWALLSAIPFVILFTLPYIGVTKANCYRLLSGQADGQTRRQYGDDPWQT